MTDPQGPIPIFTRQGNLTLSYGRQPWTNAYIWCGLKHATRGHMRTTLNIEEKLLHRAAELTGVQETDQLVKLGLEALTARESSKKLAKLGGTDRKLRRIPRRRGPGRNGLITRKEERARPATPCRTEQFVRNFLRIPVLLRRPNP